MDKTGIKTNFPYQHTLLYIPNERGLNCASDWCIDPYRWHGQFNTLLVNLDSIEYFALLEFHHEEVGKFTGFIYAFYKCFLVESI